MRLIITPGKPLRGTVRLPGDKSLSHRAALFAAMAQGTSRIGNFLQSGVTRAMLNALSAVGVAWTIEDDALAITGRGLAGWQSPAAPLDCGNSATTIRMLAGAAAAAGLGCTLDGSAGLRRRPMNRIVEPLRRMGVQVAMADHGGAPLVLAQRAAGKRLVALEETLPVASAQVKTCLLLAGLAADGEMRLREPGPSRDHTERMLVNMGAAVQSQQIAEDCYETTLQPPEGDLRAIQAVLPGDFSAAAFLLAAATITPGSEVRIEGVGLNPTRTGMIDALRMLGADISIEDENEQAGEPAGTLLVRSAALAGGEVSGPLVVRMIDEFPAFAAAAVYTGGTVQVRDAAELRLKESDRIGALCGELARLGASIEEHKDGFTIRSGGVQGGIVHPHGDHRLAMAEAVAGLSAKQPVIVEQAEIIAESFPSFAATLRTLGADIQEIEA